VSLVALALDAVSPVEARLRTTTSLRRLVAFLVVDCLAVLRAPRREQLGREREEAERAREQLQEFVGMVSHDLRNPVSAMHLATRGLWLWRGPARTKRV
jgi:signal transduction histidine kinase